VHFLTKSIMKLKQRFFTVKVRTLACLKTALLPTLLSRSIRKSDGKTEMFDLLGTVNPDSLEVPVNAEDAIS
jgi:hypothetical protein